MKPSGGSIDMAGLGAGLRRVLDRIRRDGHGPAIIVVGMVVLGTALSLFGDSLVGELGLAVLAIAGGLFATWVAGSQHRKR
jgi:hypothetical protein